jgi:hypothetical protein
MSSNHDRERPGSAGEDSTVARAWRQASDEQPPARLDAGILAAARQSVREADAGAKIQHVRPRARSRWMQWQPLAAAATVAGLAFVLVQTLPRDRELAPTIRSETPASAPAPAPEAALETRSSAPARAVTEAPVSPGGGQAAPDRSVESAARSPTPEVAADIADSLREAETDQRKGVMTAPPGDAYSAEAAAADSERAPAAVAQPSTADWAARIAALHSSGDLAGAASALREFRATDPDADARLPESLHEWARTVE